MQIILDQFLNNKNVMTKIITYLIVFLTYILNLNSCQDHEMYESEEIFKFETSLSTSDTTYPYRISSPIILDGKKNKTISFLEIQNPQGYCIKLLNCSNIIIKYCKLGPSKKEGVYLYNCKDITVTYCIMENISTGISAVESKGIKVTYNDIKNVLGPFPRGQAVQFDEVNGADNSISYNICENIAGQSHPEDAISLYKSNGIISDPIKIIGNRIRGGGPSRSGGGIITGDYGGSYITVEDNILVNPGQYGIAITSGHNIRIINNKIYAKKQSFTFWGLMSYIQYTNPTHSNTIMNNEVNWQNHQGIARNFWDDGNGGDIYGWKTNLYNPELNDSILPKIIIGNAYKAAIKMKESTAIDN